MPGRYTITIGNCKFSAGPYNITSADGAISTSINAKTADRKGQVVPVIITAYEDKTFSMEIKTSPVTGLLLKAAGIEKGSANQKTIVGKVTKAQIREIAEYKLPDLNTDDVEQAIKIIEGSARNMGIKVVD